MEHFTYSYARWPFLRTFIVSFIIIYCEFFLLLCCTYLSLILLCCTYNNYYVLLSYVVLYLITFVLYYSLHVVLCIGIHSLSCYYCMHCVLVTCYSVCLSCSCLCIVLPSSMGERLCRILEVKL